MYDVTSGSPIWLPLMVPVIAQDRLHLTPEWIGIMASMDGVGAFIGAVVVAVFVGPRLYARTYLCGVICYMVMLTVFALVAQPVPTAQTSRPEASR